MTRDQSLLVSLAIERCTSMAESSRSAPTELHSGRPCYNTLLGVPFPAQQAASCLFCSSPPDCSVLFLLFFSLLRPRALLPLRSLLATVTVSPHAAQRQQQQRHAAARASSCQQSPNVTSPNLFERFSEAAEAPVLPLSSSSIVFFALHAYMQICLLVG